MEILETLLGNIFLGGCFRHPFHQSSTCATGRFNPGFSSQASKVFGPPPQNYYLRFDIRSHSQPSSSRPSSFPLARREPHPLQGGMLTWYVGHCNCQMQEGGGECQLGPSVTLVLQTCLAVYRGSSLAQNLDISALGRPPSPCSSTIPRGQNGR